MTKKDIKILFINNKRILFKEDLIREIKRLFMPSDINKFLQKNPELLGYFI